MTYRITIQQPKWAIQVTQQIDQTISRIISIKRNQRDSNPHPPTWYVIAHVFSHFIPFIAVKRLNTHNCSFLAGISQTINFLHMAHTKVTTPISTQQTDTQHSQEKSSRSKSTGSYKKKLTTKMDALAIQLVSHPTAQDIHMSNDQAGPMAIRDYPEGSSMLLLPEERARLAAKHTRSRRCRRLFNDNSNTDSDSSQGDRPSHASVSIPSTYHHFSPDPAHLSTPHQTGSTLITPIGTQLPASEDLSARTTPSVCLPARSAPPRALAHTAELPRQNSAGHFCSDLPSGLCSPLVDDLLGTRTTQ
jgi:hypothetical protein